MLESSSVLQAAGLSQEPIGAGGRGGVPSTRYAHRADVPESEARDEAASLFRSELG